MEPAMALPLGAIATMMFFSLLRYLWRRRRDAQCMPAPTNESLNESTPLLGGERPKKHTTPLQWLRRKRSREGDVEEGRRRWNEGYEEAVSWGFQRMKRGKEKVEIKGGVRRAREEEEVEMTDDGPEPSSKVGGLEEDVDVDKNDLSVPMKKRGKHPRRITLEADRDYGSSPTAKRILEDGMEAALLDSRLGAEEDTAGNVNEDFLSNPAPVAASQDTEEGGRQHIAYPGGRRTVAEILHKSGDKLRSATHNKFDAIAYNSSRAREFPDVPSEALCNPELSEVKRRYSTDPGGRRKVTELFQTTGDKFGPVAYNKFDAIAYNSSRACGNPEVPGEASVSISGQELRRQCSIRRDVAARESLPALLIPQNTNPIPTSWEDFLREDEPMPSFIDWTADTEKINAQWAAIHGYPRLVGGWTPQDVYPKIVGLFELSEGERDGPLLESEEPEMESHEYRPQPYNEHDRTSDRLHTIHGMPPKDSECKKSKSKVFKKLMGIGLKEKISRGSLEPGDGEREVHHSETPLEEMRIGCSLGMELIEHHPPSHMNNRFQDFQKDQSASSIFRGDVGNLFPPQSAYQTPASTLPHGFDTATSLTIDPTAVEFLPNPVIFSHLYDNSTLDLSMTPHVPSPIITTARVLGTVPEGICETFEEDFGGATRSCLVSMAAEEKILRPDEVLMPMVMSDQHSSPESISGTSSNPAISLWTPSFVLDSPASSTTQALAGPFAHALDMELSSSRRISKGPDQRVCTACNAVYSSETQYLEHIQRRRCRHHTCSSCPVRFSLKADLNRHLRTVHRVTQMDAKTFVCNNPKCSAPNKRFLRKDNFERHVRRCVGSLAIA